MKDPRDLAKALLKKGNEDLRTVRLVMAANGPYAVACFHCQQAVEKYMKAFLVSRGVSYPFTHDLQELAEACESGEPSLLLNSPDVVALTAYAVQLRYDDNPTVTRADARQASQVAQRACAMVLRLVPPDFQP